MNTINPSSQIDENTCNSRPIDHSEGSEYTNVKMYLTLFDDGFSLIFPCVSRWVFLCCHFSVTHSRALFHVGIELARMCIRLFAHVCTVCVCLCVCDNVFRKRKTPIMKRLYQMAGICIHRALLKCTFKSFLFISQSVVMIIKQIM